MRISPASWLAPQAASASRVLGLLGPLVAAVVLGCGGSAPAKPAATAAGATTTKPASVTCPSFGGDAASGPFDFATAFGVDEAMGARLARMVRLVGELERTATALDTETRATCSALAVDLGATPAELGTASASASGSSATANGASASRAPHPCVTAATRLAALRKSLGTAQLSVSVSDVSCGIPKDAVASCAGECLTGKEGITSAVDCGLASSGPSCQLDFALPDASPQCVTQCAVRALRDVRCSANVDVRLGTGDGATDARFAAVAEGLRRDLPRLVTLGASVGPRALQLGKDVTALVEDLAATIDTLMDGDKAIERRVVIGAVLASCVAPELGGALRASTSLQATLTQAIDLHGALVGR
ncbi:hypothetical protein [Chondromyces crocatus]|uniref:Uncharacterized protein n=1 Tax=Chondromyces crocatus TaxID=52 RepID=A0A0K1ES97_CHOCO|nr:hypothetical protein [Chondromyces crocatus]AKT43805.1 uncharacterized protein CMC5_080420 [Chondromyces crocatus]